MAGSQQNAMEGGGREEAFCRSFGRSPSRWIAETYNVRDEFVRDIVHRFAMRPGVDAFANEKNFRLPRWWGPGSSEAQDAFSRNWGRELLWMNPPYSMWDQVVTKIIKDQAHVLLVVPVWQRKKCYKKLKTSLSGVTYPAGTIFSERPGFVTRQRGTMWPVRALLVCGHTPQCNSIKPGRITQEAKRLLPHFKQRFGDEPQVEVIPNPTPWASRNRKKRPPLDRTNKNGSRWEGKPRGRCRKSLKNPGSR